MSTDTFAGEFDYVAVFKMEENGDQSPVAQYFCQQLLKAKFEIFTYLSKQKDELYVLINATEDILKDFSDKVDYELLLEPIEVKKALEAGNPAKEIAPVRINEVGEVSQISPFQFIYGKFDSDLPLKLYCKSGHDGDLFGNSTKLKLIYALIEAPSRLGGCNLAMDKLLKHGTGTQYGGLVAFYPLHDSEAVNRIKSSMSSWCLMPWQLPFTELKKYFGEKIALYWSFLGHYSYLLLFPALVGLAIQIVVWSQNDVSSPVLPFFAVFICGWSVVFLETWKREETRIAMRWGMSDFETKELDRPEFKGKMINSYIDGSEMKFYPAISRAQKIALSMTIIALMVAMVVGTVAGIYVMRFSLQAGKSAPYASTAASILNTIQITIFNYIYSNLSVILTGYENHRTETEYEDSMIAKLFAFQFINSYASFFFLAFIASNLPKQDGAPDNFTGQCGAPTCMTPLSYNVAIIFGSRITITNFLDVAIPYYFHYANRKTETKGIVGELTRPEEDYLLAPAAAGDSLANYADTAVQYGFMTLFITSLPIACFFALISNIIKVKINAFKAFNLFRRPVPRGAQDIGSWQDIFMLISTFAVITNGALICFTMDVLKGDFTLFGRSWIFIGFQWTLLSAQSLLALLIPDVPLEVQVQKQRQEFITSKIIDLTPDEDYGENPTGHPTLTGDELDEAAASKGFIKKLLKNHTKIGDGLTIGSYPAAGAPFPQVQTINGNKTLTTVGGAGSPKPKNRE